MTFKSNGCLFRFFNYAPFIFFRNSVICSKHFKPDDFEPQAEFRQKRQLKRSAEPSCFDFPQHLQPKETKLRNPPKKRVWTEEELPTSQITDQCLENETLAPVAMELDHDYSLNDSKIIKNQLDSAFAEIENLKKQLSRERKKSHFQKKRCENLKLTVQQLKAKGVLGATANEHITQLLTPTLQHLIRRIQNQKSNPSRAKFPPELRIFASTLQFYSAKAYEYVRAKFSKALPHVATVRKWFSNIKGEPGFQDLAFNLLSKKVQQGQESNNKIVVALMLDEMSLKKQIDYDTRDSSQKGYIDLGTGENDDSSKEATQALIFMAVGVNQHFKIPIAYFFVAGKKLWF